MSGGLGFREVTARLRVPERTAQRRLRDWHRDPNGPRVTRASRPGHAGRPARTITHDELVRADPEIDDG
jgi:hypothetical protein